MNKLSITLKVEIDRRESIYKRPGRRDSSVPKFIRNIVPKLEDQARKVMDTTLKIREQVRLARQALEECGKEIIVDVKGTAERVGNDTAGIVGDKGNCDPQEFVKNKKQSRYKVLNCHQASL